MKSPLLCLPVFSLIFLLCCVTSCRQQEEKAAVGNESKDELPMEKIPQIVMGALTAKFPKAEIQKWTKEKEGDIFLYDIEFQQEGQKFEADIKEDGAIYNWEKAIEITDLPEAARKAVQSKYPNSTIKEIMEITAVHDGADVLEGYEVVLETSEKKGIEVTVAADGKILEDSGPETQNPGAQK